LNRANKNEKEMAKRLVDIENPSDLSLQEVTMPFLNSSMNQSRVRKLPISIDA